MCFRGRRGVGSGSFRTTAVAFLTLAVGWFAALPIDAKSGNDRFRQPGTPTDLQGTPAKPRIIPGSDPGGVAVALIGSGVNYTLPVIASRLARDGEGDIIGLDFVDRDNRPYDTGPDLAPAPDGGSPTGTTPASVILAEAPRARLVPVRLRLGEPRHLGGAMVFVASTPARVLVVAFSTANRADWEPFAQIASTPPAASKVLIVLSAGDTAVDLDKQPAYPAGLGLANALVVTAADQNGRLLSDGAFGAVTVDLAVPARAHPALARDGTAIEASGSMIATARVAAIAARILDADPKLSVAQLKARILAAATPMPLPLSGEPIPRTRSGWIANPEAIGYKIKP